MILSIILQENAQVPGLFETIGVAGVVVYFAILLLMIISMWKVFAKAGQPGWACIIPIYNAIVFFRVIGRPAWWLLVYIVIFGLYFYGISTMMNGSGGAVLAISGLALIVLSIIDYHRLSKSFGKGAGFTVGLILLGFIFLPILAFSDAIYQGPNGEGGSVNDADPNVLHA